MPLTSQNKLLLKNAINILNKHKHNNLDLLVNKEDYDENILSMQLIPKLNSIGRMINDIRVNNVIKYLFSDDANEIKYLLCYTATDLIEPWNKQGWGMLNVSRALEL